jgi:Ser/Thr protein kinase RdoA (MazF antagonist)
MNSRVFAAQMGLDLDGPPASFRRSCTKIRRRARLDVLLRSEQAEGPTIYVRWPEPKPDRVSVPGRRAWFDGFLFQVFPEDDDLPGLACAADPEWVRGWLTSLGLSAPPLDVEVMHYKPATRCVLLYASRDDSWVGKLYRPGEAAVVFEKSQAVFEAFSDQAPVVRPLAVESERSLLLMERVVGRRIAEFSGEERLEALGAAGRTLARLHQARTSGCLPRMSLERESLEILSIARRLEDSAPQFAREARTAGGSIAQMLLSLRPRLATCHGQCHAGQFVVGRDRAWLVDPDAACVAHPARDVGNFLATLWRFQPEEPNGAAAQAFLAGYREASGEMDPVAVRAFEALTHMRRAQICARRQKRGWTERVEILLERASLRA